MRDTTRVLVLCAAMSIPVSCGPGGGSSDADTYDGSPVDDLRAFYELMQENALAFGFADGVWDMDQGDGRLYGTAFYAHVGAEEGNAVYLARAAEARDRNVWLLDQALLDFPFFVEHFEEVIMATLGLVEYGDVTGEDAFMPEVESIIDNANDVLSLYGDYLDIGDVDSWALQLYGPTTINGSLALMNLQYAYYVNSDRRQERIDRAVEIVDAIDAEVFQGTFYKFSPVEERLDLYPNAMMLLVHTRLYEMTDDPAHLERAEGLYQAIQPLRYADRPGYYSEYSAELMGATTQDYSTLSVHNYLSLGLIRLHIATGDDAYMDEALRLLDGFVRGYLYDAGEGILVHHWIDGHIALPTDYEYFCSGCNLQYLYVLWYLFSNT